MSNRNKAIDAYILKSAAFARPILIYIRELVHVVCPVVEEKIKWSFPHFDFKGEMMCSMAAFKQHAAMSFWKAALMKDAALLETARSEEAMGHLGRITSLKDLPADKKLAGYIREAMKLNELGKKLPSKTKPSEKKELEVPEYFIKVLKKNKKALQTFQVFSFSHKKEYVTWITEAKTEETRNKRMDTAVEWMEVGKGRHWKYQRK